MNPRIMHKKLFLLFFVLVALFADSQAQRRLSPADIKFLQRKEDSLKFYSFNLVNSSSLGRRLVNDSIFIRVLVRALKIKNSFYFPFDSCQTVSRLYAPDSSFRIFTWQVPLDGSAFRQYGAMQMNTNDGSLKLIPLFDHSDFTKKPQDSVRSNQNWIGALYYRVILKEYNKKKYYTLLGYENMNMRLSRKWIEVLTFNEKNEPVFGGPFFSFANDTAKVKPKPVARFVMEYKKEGNARMTYDPELDMIVYDHLVSETNTPEFKETFVPDGDYEAFKWENGKWIHVEKVFDFKLEDKQFPVPNPLYDQEGNPEYNKLPKKPTEKEKKKPAKPDNKQQPKQETEY
jgi:outer membrane lipoprotein-sorting protein